MGRGDPRQNVIYPYTKSTGRAAVNLKCCTLQEGDAGDQCLALRGVGVDYLKVSKSVLDWGLTPRTMEGRFYKPYLEGRTFERAILLQKVQKSVQVELAMEIVKVQLREGSEFE
jgi:hypothetical protein